MVMRISFRMLDFSFNQDVRRFQWRGDNVSLHLKQKQYRPFDMSLEVLDLDFVKETNVFT